MPNTDINFDLLTSISLAKNQLSGTGIDLSISGTKLNRLVEEVPPTVFLSIILRTLGTRNSALVDCLLSLEAQTNQSYEIILIGHNLSEESQTDIRNLISKFPQQFQSKITFLQQQGGNRVSPLILGFNSASGQYLSVLDDDDVVFGNWVHEFHKHSISSYPRALRSVVVSQGYALSQSESGREWPEAKSWPSLQYPTHFSLVDHLLVNRSPFMSFAFPLGIARLLEIQFDNDLLVVEDWDFILKFATTVGIHDFPVITAIYRKWNSQNQSINVHSVSEWKASEQKILNKYIESSILLPPGSFQRIRRLLEIEEKFNSGVERLLKITGLFFPILLAARRFILGSLRKIKRIIVK